MRIGIVCYASLGGSGIVATELARHLVARGHEVHVLSSDVPFRLQSDPGGVVFRKVETPAYPLFREPQYLLALATAIVKLARECRLDVVHAHYAVPHATAAWLACEILAATEHRRPSVVTTLHGTDITLVGSDPSYTEAVAFSIDRSDAVTTVSADLRQSTIAALGVTSDIDVVYNFLDCDRYRRQPDAALRERLCPAADYDALVVHLSNFRPVKRVPAVVDVFSRVRRRVRAKLVLAGEGPDTEDARLQADVQGVAAHVEIVPPMASVVPLLSVADLFLLPSLQESFGLAALEAMACGVPVVASRVGGLPEVIDHGETGFLHPPEDLDGMATSGIRLLTDPALHARVAGAARHRVDSRFCVHEVVPQYEALYARLRASGSSTPA